MDPWIGATRRPAHVQVIGRDLWRSSCRRIAGDLNSNCSAERALARGLTDTASANLPMGCS
jgi:hypothetical protein